MKKLIVLIISFQVISAGSFMSEVAKINFLVHHYYEHEKAGSSLGIIGFLKLHYSDRMHEESDPRHHGSLPLHQTLIQNNIVYCAPIESISVGLFVESASVDLNPIEKAMRSQPIHCSIFQPPRIG